ncbi:ABC transporter permease [uncultured Intestinimonas sp.]|uniref:ABC transporter permease n=1 Tax=uncultured Intestinimonas sp. TaxID=1689265 RepID=UPI0025DB92E3|nr:ABC transporter permease [uncultured Intestinimonas sp.]
MSIILQNIFSTEFVYMWIRVVTPILLPALGGAICNRAGVVNLGLEGIMLLSALAGVLGSAFGGGLLAGLAAGLGTALLVSLVFAYFHLNLKADATICGTAINTLASGFTVLLLFTITGEKGTSASLKSFSFSTVNIPLVEDIPVIGKILSGHNLMTYVALLAVVAVWFLLYKMPLGLRIRSVGENPNAASSVGVNVRRTRYIAILLCGALTGLGGMYMSMGYLGMFTREMVAGRGFIALAAAAMGQSTPIGVFLSSMLFAFFDGMSNTLQLLALPSQFIDMLPYLATIGGLTAYSIQRARKAKRRLAE